MANTLTELYNLDCNINSVGPQRLKELQYLTVDTDVELHSPVDGRHGWLTSWMFSEGSATTLKLKSRSQSLTGTIATTNGSAAAVGTDTLFLTELAVGQEVVVADGDTREIATIPSNTSLTFTSNAATTVSGKTFKRQKLINRSLELGANQGALNGLDTDLLPIASAKSESLVMQASVAITSMTLTMTFPAQMKIGNKN